MSSTNTSPDITDPQSLNQYSYADNDPTSPTVPGKQSDGKWKKLKPCTQLSLDDPNTFWNKNFITPDELEKFFQSQTKAPSGWDGVKAVKAFSAQGINPGVAAGIIGAETSFGNGRYFTTRNARDPFSSGGSNFSRSLARGLGAVTKIEDASNMDSPTLQDLIDQANYLNEAYTGDPMPVRQQWLKNVNSWFRKLAKFLGKCK